MNTKNLMDSKPKTDEEYKAEIDRMIPEIASMLKNAGKMSEQARSIGDSNRQRLDAMEKQLSCGKL